ncbi:MAG: hypothetical protein HY716_03795 [Planctomycetes bacterium]|nr:hypothetical protein [Planctomycetota bacterium]
MMQRRIAVGAVLGLACASLALAGGGPNFVKFQQAKVLAAMTGKPIAVYATVDSKGAGC